jgi:hypothetical protein
MFLFKKKKVDTDEINFVDFFIFSWAWWYAPIIPALGR